MTTAPDGQGGCERPAMAAERKDVWASGNAYEPYVGRWSRLVGRQFVTWLGVPPNKVWLDVGCGTGALCEVIFERASPHHVIGIDPSDGFVSFAGHKVTDQRATFQVGDAQKLSVSDRVRRGSRCSWRMPCRNPDRL
jgi:SAM-dependent methyltransferase